MNIYEKYQKALSKEQKVALSFFTALADELSIKACLVGGIVRDMLLSRPFQDIDVVLETDAIIFVHSDSSLASSQTLFCSTHPSFV